MLQHFRVEFSNKGHVGEIILNQPNTMNLLSIPWALQLSEILDKLLENDIVRVILIWAEGKLFTAGINLKELTFTVNSFPEGSVAVKSAHFLKTVKEFQEPFTKLHKSKKPVVVAVHGKCIGGGVDLISACDIRFCTADATFSVKETQIGLVADLGTIPRLTRIVGKGIYSEMIFTGEPLNSDRALSSGLVNMVYKNKEELLAGAREMCNKIANNSPLVVQGAKKVLQFAEEHSFDDTLDYVGVWNAAFLESEDLHESLLSFMQKRKPVFVNKL